MLALVNSLGHRLKLMKPSKHLYKVKIIRKLVVELLKSLCVFHVTCLSKTEEQRLHPAYSVEQFKKVEIVPSVM